MRVKLFETGEAQEVSESYGRRLIEQGKAALAPANKKTEPKAKEKGKRE